MESSAQNLNHLRQDWVMRLLSLPVPGDSETLAHGGAKAAMENVARGTEKKIAPQKSARGEVRIVLPPHTVLWLQSTIAKAKCNSHSILVVTRRLATRRNSRAASL